MKNIFSIFKTDLKNILKTKAAIVVIIALMILPSMYAWFNIIPSWDPYANTADVSVAIANLDEGTTVENEQLNIGDTIVDSLKKNKNLGWTFVTEEEALKGVEKGDYYASIIIPADFSQKLTSVLDEAPEKPILDYYINEKINAIAPKVTNAGASGIIESIQSGFVKVANEAIFTAFNDVGIELEANRASIKLFRDSIYQIEKDLPEIERLLGVADTDLVKVEQAIKRASEGIVQAEEISKDVQTKSEKVAEILQKSDQSIQKYMPLAITNLQTLQKSIQQFPTFTEQLVDKGEDVDQLFEDITEKTTKIDDGVHALDELTTLLTETNKQLTEEQQLGKLIEQLQLQSSNMEKLQTSIETAIQRLEKESPLDSEITDKLDELTQELGNSSLTEAELKKILNNSVSGTHADGIQKELNQLEQSSTSASNLSNTLATLPQNNEDTLNALQETLQQLENGQEAIQSVIQFSEKLQTSFDNGILLDGIDRIENLQTSLLDFKAAILTSIEKGQQTKEMIGDTLDEFNKKAAQLDTLMTDLILFIDETFMPKYEEISTKANAALDEGTKMLEKANSSFPTMIQLLEKIDQSTLKGKDGLAVIHENFPEAKEKIIDIAQRIRTLEEQGDLDQVIKLMKNDPDAESDFFSDPILLNEHQLFPIPNYGSAMAPFFTAMSLWVGGLILVSSLIVDVPNKHQYKSYEAYFGRFLTFWSIGLVQALIVTAGNLFLLKTFVAHKIIFILFGFIISTTFVTIVYTLVSVFGNTGKVIAIVLLVMQLGASGGTFPIQMTPSFFQKIHVFLPFTHALGLFREAVGGIIWSNVIRHIAWLLGYIGLFLFIGIKLKERINKSSDKFLEEARKSDVIL